MAKPAARTSHTSPRWTTSRCLRLRGISSIPEPANGRKLFGRAVVHFCPMTGTHSATIDSLQAVPAGQGDHHFFLNHLATVKVAAGESESGLALVEFLAPRGFGPPLHAHSEEDELMFVLEGN